MIPRLWLMSCKLASGEENYSLSHIPIASAPDAPSSDDNDSIVLEHLLSIPQVSWITPFGIGYKSFVQSIQAKDVLWLVLLLRLEDPSFYTHEA